MTSKIKGRPANNPPAIAFEYRRYITLVQVLALSGSDEGIRTLCEKWNVEPVMDYSGTYSSHPCMNQWATIRALAQHAMEYHRTEGK